MDVIRVLIAEDEEEMSELLRRWLSTHSRFEVVGVAADGAQATRLAAEMRPDLVILDLDMPELSGDLAIPRIRSHLPEVKVIVFSGTNPNEEYLLECGADLVMVKARAPLSQLPENALALFDR